VMATMMTPVMSHACGWSGWGGVAVLCERKAAQAEHKHKRQHEANYFSHCGFLLLLISAALVGRWD